MDRTAVRPSTARPVSRRHENLYRQPTRRNHQVNINGGLDAVVAKRLADHGSNGQVGHVVVVHDVKVNHVGARFQKRLGDLPAPGPLRPRFAAREEGTQFRMSMPNSNWNIGRR